MTPLILVLLFVTAAPALIYAFLVFDEILEKEYREHRTEWEKAGRPIGFFWVPKEGKVLAGSAARNRLWMSWFFSPPTWSKSRSDAAPLFKKLKIAEITFVSLWVVMMIVLFAFPK